MFLAISDHRAGNHIALIIAAFGVPTIIFLLEKKRQWQSRREPGHRSTELGSNSSSSPGVTPTTIPHAVLIPATSAGVYEAVGEDAKILRIGAADQGDTPAAQLHWSIEGRRQIYLSHQLR